MAKKASDSETTVENRVYLFKDLASAYVSAQAGLLSSANPADRARALRALGDLAHASCVVADTAKLDASSVGERVAKGAAVARPESARGAAPSRARARSGHKARRG